jgi:hypothetical protein
MGPVLIPHAVRVFPVVEEVLDVLDDPPHLAHPRCLQLLPFAQRCTDIPLLTRKGAIKDVL